MFVVYGLLLFCLMFGVVYLEEPFELIKPIKPFLADIGSENSATNIVTKFTICKFIHILTIIFFVTCSDEKEEATYWSAYQAVKGFQRDESGTVGKSYWQNKVVDFAYGAHRCCK